MEILTYNQLCTAHEAPTEYEITLFAGFNWRELPNSAWLTLLSSAVVVSSLSMTATAQAVQVDTPSGTCLNARYGPGTQYGIYTCVREGATLRPVINRSGEWLQLSSGRWVYGPYTTYDGGGMGGSGGTGGGNSIVAGTAVINTNNSPLNVRNSPGGRIVGSLADGTRVSLSGREAGGWSQLSNGNWVATRWLSGTGGGTGGGNIGIGTTAVVETNGARLRVRNSPDGAIVASLPDGARVNLSGRTANGWSQLSNGNWVATRWLSGTGGGTGGGTVGTIAVVNTNGSPLLVRNSPNGAIVGDLANGTRIALSGRTADNWSQLSNGNWVATRWISANGGGTGGGSMMLRPGSQGLQVAQLQQRLADWGLYYGPIDGIYGPATTAAVRGYQTRRDNLQVDGIAGTSTLVSLGLV